MRLKKDEKLIKSKNYQEAPKILVLKEYHISFFHFFFLEIKDRSIFNK